MKRIEKARLLLVDDHNLFRAAVQVILDQQPDLSVIAQAEDGESALAMAQALSPDLILMDINMPGMGGLEATRIIKERMPSSRILVLTASEEQERLLQAMQAGAQGYLVKTMEPSEFLRQIRMHLGIEGLIASQMTMKMLRMCTEKSESRRRTHLTRRELDVLSLVGEGASNRDIARRLAIAENTVKNHLRNILQKLHFGNRVQAAAYAIRQGLVPRERPGKTNHH